MELEAFHNLDDFNCDQDIVNFLTNYKFIKFCVLKCEAMHFQTENKDVNDAKHYVIED